VVRGERSFRYITAASSAYGHYARAAANPDGHGDRFLNGDEVAAIIGKSRSWVEKNTDALPCRRKVGGEGLWSEREIQRWMKHREPWV
jgi:predicted DNA-binding transcriptional regulator AlpA